MKKEWIKNADFNYSLWIEGMEKGKMEIQLSNMAGKAICNIDGMEFEIQRTGFWKSDIEITDGDGAVMLKTYPEKWYANASVIEFENKLYKLIIRNNPLAEFAVTENGNDVLAYGLNTNNGELNVRISTSGNSHIIFDFLLWYLFLPVANENFADTFSFFILQ